MQLLMMLLLAVTVASEGLFACPTKKKATMLVVTVAGRGEHPNQYVHISI